MFNNFKVYIILLARQRNKVILFFIGEDKRHSHDMNLMDVFFIQIVPWEIHIFIDKHKAIYRRKIKLCPQEFQTCSL